MKFAFIASLNFPGVVGASETLDGPHTAIVDGETFRVDWDHEPTQQEKDDLQAAINAADYNAWFAEHGGNAAQTARRIAKEVLAKANDHSNMVDKAIVLELVDVLNVLATRHNDLLTWLGTQTTLTNRGQLTNFAFPTPTPAQARTSIINRITAGEADS